MISWSEMSRFSTPSLARKSSMMDWTTGEGEGRRFSP